MAAGWRVGKHRDWKRLKSYFHRTDIWNRREPWVQCLAWHLSSFSSIFFFFFCLCHLPSVVSCSLFLSAPSRCRTISQRTQEPMSPYIHGSLKRKPLFAAHLGKHLRSSSLFFAAMMRWWWWWGGVGGAPARKVAFETKATCRAGQPVVRQGRSLWWTQVLGCPLACLSFSVVLLAGHL